MPKLKVNDVVSVEEDGEKFQGVVVKVKEVNCDIKFEGKDTPETHRIENVTLISQGPGENEPIDKGDTTGDEAQQTANEAQVKLDADREQLEKDQAELAEKQAELKEQQDSIQANIEKSITVSESEVDLGKFNKADNPTAFAAEKAKQNANCAKRKINRIKKAQVAAETTPVQSREKLLRARLTKIRRGVHHTYRKEQIEIWAKELTLIIQTPEAWSPNCVKPKKQVSVLDKLDKVLGV